MEWGLFVFFSTTAERRGHTQAKTKHYHYQEVTNAFDKTDVRYAT
jgi:hypothetical protein